LLINKRDAHLHYIVFTQSQSNIINDVILIDQYTQKTKEDVSLLLIKFLLFMFMEEGLGTHQQKTTYD